jgi:hypothetical protein
MEDADAAIGVLRLPGWRASDRRCRVKHPRGRAAERMRWAPSEKQSCDAGVLRARSRRSAGVLARGGAPFVRCPRETVRSSLGDAGVEGMGSDDSMEGREAVEFCDSAVGERGASRIPADVSARTFSLRDSQPWITPQGLTSSAQRHRASGVSATARATATLPRRSLSARRPWRWRGACAVELQTPAGGTRSRSVRRAVRRAGGRVLPRALARTAGERWSSFGRPRE